MENLEIWGSHKYPYDGYLPLRLRFSAVVTGVPQVEDTLAPDPQTKEGIAILVCMNTCEEAVSLLS